MEESSREEGKELNYHRGGGEEVEGKQVGTAAPDGGRWTRTCSRDGMQRRPSIGKTLPIHWMQRQLTCLRYPSITYDASIGEAAQAQYLTTTTTTTTTARMRGSCVLSSGSCLQGIDRAAVDSRSLKGLH